MPTTEETHARLAEIPNLTVSRNTPLSRHTRFGIGGPAAIFAETGSAEAFIAAMTAARASGIPTMVIGGGTNLIVSDHGFGGIVLRYRAESLHACGDDGLSNHVLDNQGLDNQGLDNHGLDNHGLNNQVIADAGAVLQDLVDFTVARGLKGLETLAGIPGSVGAAIYGNAGAYGHSISERVVNVRFYDGAAVRVFNNEECRFRYRESVFKQHKEWIVFSTQLLLEPAPAEVLRKISGEILTVRNQKFPVTMKCAGSIFKNLILNELPAAAAAEVPASAVREGKVPAAWFLEQVGAKGMQRGDIHVAGYHANLIYNAGAGSAAELCALIQELKARVRDRFGLELEEEVQYVG